LSCSYSLFNIAQYLANSVKDASPRLRLLNNSWTSVSQPEKKKKKKKKNLCYNVCNENTVNNPCCHGYDNQILVTLAPGSVKLAPGADCICSCKSNCHTIMTICFLVDKGLL
jgi:hypothetical protein